MLEGMGKDFLDTVQEDERKSVAKWIRETSGIWEEGVHQILLDLADQIEAGDYRRYEEYLATLPKDSAQKRYLVPASLEEPKCIFISYR
jgi:thioredoxin-like negative regulator of GroEL